MTSQTPATQERHSTAPPRTGLVGRLTRLLLGAVLAWISYDFWLDRSYILAEVELGVMLVTALAAYGVYALGAGYGRPWLSLGTASGLAVAAGATALLTTGQLWASPLNWFVWGLDLGFLGFVSATMLIATATGTPGCELAVVRELTHGRDRAPAPGSRGPAGGAVMQCLIGLHLLDAWEARRNQSR